MSDRTLRGVKFSMTATWLKRLSSRCACCRALIAGPSMTAQSVVLPLGQRRRLGFDVVVTCGAHYCIARATKGEIKL